MATTTLSSATKEVTIGFGHPFVMIGERINPTGRKILAAEMKEGDYSRVVADAIAQVAAGAQMLDVNAGIPLADEPAILAESIRRVQEVVDVPISIDSSIVLSLRMISRASKLVASAYPNASQKSSKSTQGVSSLSTDVYLVLVDIIRISSQSSW